MSFPCQNGEIALNASNTGSHPTDTVKRSYDEVVVAGNVKRALLDPA